MGGQKPVGARRSRGNSQLGRGADHRTGHDPQSQQFSVWGSPLMLNEGSTGSRSTSGSADHEGSEGHEVDLKSTGHSHGAISNPGDLAELDDHTLAAAASGARAFEMAPGGPRDAADGELSGKPRAIDRAADGDASEMGISGTLGLMRGRVASLSWPQLYQASSYHASGVHGGNVGGTTHSHWTARAHETLTPPTTPEHRSRRNPSSLGAGSMSDCPLDELPVGRVLCLPRLLPSGSYHDLSGPPSGGGGVKMCLVAAGGLQLESLLLNPTARELPAALPPPSPTRALSLSSLSMLSAGLHPGGLHHHHAAPSLSADAVPFGHRHDPCRDPCRDDPPLGSSAGGNSSASAELLAPPPLPPPLPPNLFFDQNRFSRAELDALEVSSIVFFLFCVLWRLLLIEGGGPVFL